jgi:hypothetical protein
MRPLAHAAKSNLIPTHPISQAANADCGFQIFFKIKEYLSQGSAIVPSGHISVHMRISLQLPAAQRHVKSSVQPPISYEEAPRK